MIADVQEERGEALAAELGDVVSFARTDVTVEDDVAAAVDLAVARFGRLDAMCNNAGIVGVVGPIAETPMDATTARWPSSCGACSSGSSTRPG